MQNDDARHDLDTAMVEVAGAEGEPLASTLLEKLERWARKHIGESCSIAAFARLECDSILQFSSRGVDGPLLCELSVRLGRSTTSDVARDTDTTTGAKNIRIISPLRLAHRRDLEGHLFILSEQELEDHAAHLAKLASEAVSILLIGEITKNDWKRHLNVARHALVGSAQGMHSAALAVIDIAKDLPATEHTRSDLDNCAVTILSEAEILRLRSSTARVFSSVQCGKMGPVRTRDVDLRALISACVQRHAPLFQRRSVGLEFSWKPKRPLTIVADADLLDIAISNLLDNARDHAYPDSNVTLEVTPARWMQVPSVCIQVQDVGRGIDEGKAETIYSPPGYVVSQKTGRYRQKVGVGLYVTKTIAEAHGGSLRHRSVPSKESKKEARFSVSFELILPVDPSRVPGSPGINRGTQAG